MAQVDLVVNGRDYTVACDDGQEDHLRRLAAYLDKRVGELSASMGQIGDARLLVMAGLLVSDELMECFEEIKSLKAELESVSQAKSAPARQAEEDAAEKAKENQKLNSLAERMETVAEKLTDA